MKLKAILLLLLIVVSVSLTMLTSCLPEQKVKDKNDATEGNTAIPDDGNSDPTNKDENNTLPDETDDPKEPEETPVLAILETPEGHEFRKFKNAALLVPKKVNITECYTWQGKFYYYVERNDDNNERLYYCTTKNYIEEGTTFFIIPAGTVDYCAKVDRTAINKYGYGFELAGSELNILPKKVSTENRFEWNGSWYYFYEDDGFGPRYVRSDIGYHLRGMDSFWVKGRVELYRFVQL